MAKVGVAGDGCGALKALKAGFGFSLGVRVEVCAAEKFVAADAFLSSKFRAGVFLIIVCSGTMSAINIALSNKIGLQTFFDSLVAHGSEAHLLWRRGGRLVPTYLAESEPSHAHS